MAAAEKEEYALYKKLAEEVEAERTQYGRAVAYFGMVTGMIEESPNMLKSIMNKDNATTAEVEENTRN